MSAHAAVKTEVPDPPVADQRAMSTEVTFLPVAHARRQQEEVPGEGCATYDGPSPPSRANFGIVATVGCRGRRVVVSRLRRARRPRGRATRRAAVLAAALLVPDLDRGAPVAPPRGARAHRRGARRRHRC